MGLDMYLNRMPRYKRTTAAKVSAIENYLDWMKDKEDPESDARNHTLEGWCGVKQNDLPPQDYIDFYSQFYNTKYSVWDKEKKYGWARIMEQVGYWRKANQIHNWFVDAVQNGEDDCRYHNEVTKEILEDLLDTCETVLKNSELVEGQIQNGYHFEHGEMVPDMCDGKYIKDPSIAMELLPSASGFFFGGTDYDEYYLDDIKETIDIITKVLETTDFDKEMIYYVSSW
jgi:hypothetical protein